jgi:hypothetical protein
LILIRHLRKPHPLSRPLGRRVHGTREGSQARASRQPLPAESMYHRTWVRGLVTDPV